MTGQDVPRIYDVAPFQHYLNVDGLTVHYAATDSHGFCGDLATERFRCGGEVWTLPTLTIDPSVVTCERCLGSVTRLGRAS